MAFGPSRRRAQTVDQSPHGCHLGPLRRARENLWGTILKVFGSLLWGPLGGLWGLSGGFLGALRNLLWACWGLPGASRGLRGAECSNCPFGPPVDAPSWNRLGRLGNLLGHLRALLGRLGALASWGRLGIAVGGPLIFGRLGALLDCLGAPQRPLGDYYKGPGEIHTRAQGTVADLDESENLASRNRSNWVHRGVKTYGATHLSKWYAEYISTNYY